MHILLSFKLMSYFVLIVATHLCVYEYIKIFLNVIFSVCMILLVCTFFRADHRAQDNQPVLSPLEMTVCALSISQLPVALCVGLRPCGLSLVHTGIVMSIWCPCSSHV